MICKYTNQGKSCKAHAIQDSEYCFSHNPASKKDHLAATKKGGSVRREDGLAALKPVNLKKPQALFDLLADTINRVRRVREDGSMDIKTANCIGFLASKLLDAQKIITLDERLTKIEETVATQHNLR